MAQFTVDIPDELLPALLVEFSLVKDSTTATTVEEHFAASVVETVRQRAQIHKVGPYYTGPILPQYNPDGTPYSEDWAPPEPVDPDTEGAEDSDTEQPVEVEA